jgi:hypothetical protein
VSDREFEEAADAVYAEIAEALEAAVEPVLCLAAVGRMLVELARAAWRHRPPRHCNWQTV